MFALRVCHTLTLHSIECAGCLPLEVISITVTSLLQLCGRATELLTGGRVKGSTPLRELGSCLSQTLKNRSFASIEAKYQFSTRVIYYNYSEARLLRREMRKIWTEID